MAPFARDARFPGHDFHQDRERTGAARAPWGGAAQLLLAQAAGEGRDGLAAHLAQVGYEVTRAETAPEALHLLHRGHPFAVVLCDARLFRLPNQELLPLLRAEDAQLPVVWVAEGERTAGDAATAPLLQLVAEAVQVRNHTRAQYTANLIASHAPRLIDGAPSQAQFAEALAQLYMVYQPIVRVGRASAADDLARAQGAGPRDAAPAAGHNTGAHPGAPAQGLSADGTSRTFGLEALVRSRSTVFSHPGTLFDAAEQQGKLLALGRCIRAQVAADIGRLPAEAKGPIFVNLHTRDLLDEALYDAEAPLSQHAARVVLEITERHALDEVLDVGRRVARLRSLGYRIAIDDLGAGYAGLTTLAQVEPEVVKLDMALVRDLQLQPIKRKVVQALANLCRDLGILVIAEGIENLAERDLLVQVGIDYLQGYFFGRPEQQLKLELHGRPWVWPAVAPRVSAACSCGRAGGANEDL